MSLFDWQGIPESLLRIQYGHSNIDPSLEALGEHSNESGNEDEVSEGDVDDRFEEDLLTLRDYSFVSIDTTSFEMHRLVQLATRTRLEAHKQIENWRQKYIISLYSEFPTGTYENWVKCRKLFPHVKAALAQQPEDVESQKEWCYTLYRAANYACELGNFGDAETLAQKSLERIRNVLGEEHKDTLRSMAMLGLIYRCRVR